MISRVEIQELLVSMVKRLETSDSVTEVFNREDYERVFTVLGDNMILKLDKSILLKVNVQDSIMVVRMERKV